MNKFFCFLLIALAVSCSEQPASPKPRMYPRVVFPDRNPVRVSPESCEFSFTFPDFGVVKKDSFFFGEEPIHPCWFDVQIQDLNAVLYCCYYPISTSNSLDKLIIDAFAMAGKHNLKANYRRESLIENPGERVFGLLFDIEGPVATPVQFFLTDSTHHFFRASLYFNDKVDPDSTKIVLDFLKPDISKMIESFSWQKK